MDEVKISSNRSFGIVFFVVFLLIAFYPLIYNGDIILLKNIPNLNQILFKGVKILEFNKPKTKKIIEVITDHNLTSPLYVNG